MLFTSEILYWKIEFISQLYLMKNIIIWLVFLLFFFLSNVYAFWESDKNFWVQNTETNSNIQQTRYVGLGVGYTNYTYRPYIAKVQPNSPAERSWFKVWDLVIEVNGEKIFTNEWPFIEWSEWEDFSVTVLRSGQRVELTGTLGEFFVQKGEYLWTPPIKETEVKGLKTSAYLNEYEIVNYNSDYKYVLLMTLYEKRDYYNSLLDDKWNLWEWIITKEINTPTFSVHASDLSENYESEKNKFMWALYVEIDWEYYYGNSYSASNLHFNAHFNLYFHPHINLGYFNLTSEWKEDEIFSAIRTNYSSDVIQDAKIEKILLAYKNKVWEKVFKQKMSKLHQIIDERITTIVTKIRSEKDIIAYSKTLLKLQEIRVISFEMSAIAENLLHEIEFIYNEIEAEDD